ncbi:MAG: DNA and RNA helicase [Bacillota bacterium]
MFSNQFPFFKRGNILKTDMLNNLRDYPRDLVNLYFSDYSDGILVGSNLKIEGQEIVIKPGIIKFRNQIYLLTQDLKLKYHPTNEEIMIKIKFETAEESNDFKSWNSDLFLDEELDLAVDEFELGRFKLREGASLRTDYNKFSDFSTEYNTVNIINVKYSCLEEATLHPVMMSFFANKILDSDTKDPFNISFAIQTLQTGRVSRKLIKKYLRRQLELTEDSYSNLEIYRYLARIIRQLSDYKVQTREHKRENKILID